ncbi:MAG: DNA-binding protein [Planctomycetia bacterium]|nr:DNA-binding protein [Planctomycetia bacterium]
MHIEFELSGEQAQQLQALTEQLGVDPSELARSTCLEFLSRPADDFVQTAQQVLKKNRELYRRLA